MDRSPGLIAHMDFRPVPAHDRQTPGRVKSVPARLYIDKFIEHRQAYSFVQNQQSLHGEGSKVMVRALLHYRDDVIYPLEELRERQAQSGRRNGNIPDKYLIARLAFRPVPPEARHNPGRLKHVSARLYIDKFVEHREAYEFVASQQELHGEGLKALVRALLHYRDTIILPSQLGAVDTGKPQLELDVEGE